MYSRTPKRRAKPHAQAWDRRSTGNQSRPPCDAASSLCGGRRAPRAGASAGVRVSVHGRGADLARAPRTTAHHPAAATGPQRVHALWPRAGASPYSAPPRCGDRPSARACAVTSRGRLPLDLARAPRPPRRPRRRDRGATGGGGTGGRAAPGRTGSAAAAGAGPVVFCRRWLSRSAFCVDGVGILVGSEHAITNIGRRHNHSRPTPPPRALDARGRACGVTWAPSTRPGRRIRVWASPRPPGAAGVRRLARAPARPLLARAPRPRLSGVARCNTSAPAGWCAVTSRPQWSRALWRSALSGVAR